MLFGVSNGHILFDFSNCCPIVIVIVKSSSSVYRCFSRFSVAPSSPQHNEEIEALCLMGCVTLVLFLLKYASWCRVGQCSLSQLWQVFSLRILEVFNFVCARGINILQGVPKMSHSELVVITASAA